MSPEQWINYLQKGLDYHSFLEKYGTDADRKAWEQVYSQVLLKDQQRRVLHGFQRDLYVLCLASAWCGDCAAQCPVFARFAEETERIHLSFVERDAEPELRDYLKINGGHRIPVLVFLSEDGYEAARYGDRTLSRYRWLVAKQLGVLPDGTPQDENTLLARVTQEWLDEFERVHWMLRLSPRLRKIHCD